MELMGCYVEWSVWKAVQIYLRAFRHLEWYMLEVIYHLDVFLTLEFWGLGEKTYGWHEKKTETW